MDHSLCACLGWWPSAGPKYDQELALLKARMAISVEPSRVSKSSHAVVGVLLMGCRYSTDVG